MMERGLATARGQSADRAPEATVRGGPAPRVPGSSSPAAPPQPSGEVGRPAFAKAANRPWQGEPDGQTEESDLEARLSRKERQVVELREQIVRRTQRMGWDTAEEQHHADPERTGPRISEAGPWSDVVPTPKTFEGELEWTLKEIQAHRRQIEMHAQHLKVLERRRDELLAAQRGEASDKEPLLDKTMDWLPPPAAPRVQHGQPRGSSGLLEDREEEPILDFTQDAWLPLPTPMLKPMHSPIQPAWALESRRGRSTSAGDASGSCPRGLRPRSADTHGTHDAPESVVPLERGAAEGTGLRAGMAISLHRDATGLDAQPDGPQALNAGYFRHASPSPGASSGWSPDAAPDGRQRPVPGPRRLQQVVQPPQDYAAAIPVASATDHAGCVARPWATAHADPHVLGFGKAHETERIVFLLGQLSLRRKLLVPFVPQEHAGQGEGRPYRFGQRHVLICLAPGGGSLMVRELGGSCKDVDRFIDETEPLEAAAPAAEPSQPLMGSLRSLLGRGGAAASTSWRKLFKAHWYGW